MIHIKKLFGTALLVLLPLFASAQNITVKGNVTDDSGEPIIGASVIQNGTQNGVITDLNGNYSISVPGSATLVYSSIGYVNKTVEVLGKVVINVVLDEDHEMLDEVIVVGYGQMRKSDLTGSVASVSVDRNKAVYDTGIDHLLQGNTPGVYVNSGDSQIGGLMNVRIRGTSTLNGNKEPLYVVDGIIMDDATEDTGNNVSSGSYGDPVQTTQSGLTGVNPQDIESIEVLKDASATAIYGSRGSNGVVLITTKQGKNQRARIQFSSGIEVGKASKHIDLLTADEYITYRNEKNPGTFSETFSPQTRDWQKELYQKSVTQSYRLSLTGGKDGYSYYVAGGYQDSDAMVKNTGLSQLDLTGNFKYKLNDRLSVKGKFNIVHRINDMTSGTDGRGNSNTSLTRHAILAKPYADVDPIEDDDSGLQLTPTNWLTDYIDHSEENRAVTSIAFDYDITKDLTFHVQGSYDTRDKTRSRWYGTGIYTGMVANGQLGISEMKSIKQAFEALFYYDHKFNRHHRLSGTVGITYERRDINRFGMLGENFSITTLGIDGIEYANTTYTNTHSLSNEQTASALARANYNYRDRYLVTFTGRLDGSSKFQKANRYGFFPSVAAAWRIDKENFLDDVDWISNLKLRAGWGQTGNQSISAFATQTTYGSAEYSSGEGANIVGLAPSKIANPDLKWETTTQGNIGLDFSAVDGRFTLTVDAYDKVTEDILQSMDAAASTGQSSIYVNRGTIRNKGIEFSFNAVPVSTRYFSWSIGGNLSLNRNKIEDLGLPLTQFGTEYYEAYYGTNLSYNGDVAFPINIFIKGQPVGVFWGYKTNGIFQSDEEAAGITYKGNVLGAGDIAYIDTNKDGTITTEDRVIIGDPNPDFTYGFNTNFTYRSFSLSAQFFGSYGNDVVNANKLDNCNTYSAYNILKEAYYEAWRADKPSKTYPKLGTPTKELTDRYVEDGSFLRLSSLSLSWNAPIKRSKIFKAVQLTVTGRNLFTWTKYTGYNPDVNSFTNDSKRIGIDYGSMPIARTYSFTANLTF